MSAGTHVGRYGRIASGLSVSVLLMTAFGTIPAHAWSAAGAADPADSGTASIGVVDSGPTVAGNQGLKAINPSGAGQVVGDLRLVVPNTFAANDKIVVDLNVAGVLTDDGQRQIRFNTSVLPKAVATTWLAADAKINATSGQLTVGAPEVLPGGTAATKPTAVPLFTVTASSTGGSAVNNRLEIKANAAAPAGAGKWVVTLSGIKVDLLPTVNNPNEMDGQQLRVVASGSATNDPVTTGLGKTAALAMIGGTGATLNLPQFQLEGEGQQPLSDISVDEKEPGKFGAVNGIDRFKITLSDDVTISTTNATCSVKDITNPSTPTNVSGASCAVNKDLGGSSNALAATITGVPDYDDRVPSARKRNRAVPMKLRVVYSGVTAEPAAGKTTYTATVDPQTAAGFQEQGTPVSAGLQTDLVNPLTSNNTATSAVRKFSARIADANAEKQAELIAKANFRVSTAMVVAPKDSYADMITAAAVARARNAPLLLSDKTTLWGLADGNNDTVPDVGTGFGIWQRANDFKTSEVIFVGDFPGLTNANKTLLKHTSTGIKTITEYKGNDVYQTNKAATDALFPNSANVGTTMGATATVREKTAVVMSGASFNDGIAGVLLALGEQRGPTATQNPGERLPIVLSAATKLGATTSTQLASMGIQKVFIVGGTGAISKSVEAELANLNVGGSGTTKIRVIRVDDTNNRYKMAAKINAGLVAPLPTAGNSLAFGWTLNGDVSMFGKLSRSVLLVNGEDANSALVAAVNGMGRDLLNEDVLFADANLVIPVAPGATTIHPDLKTFLVNNKARLNDVIPVGLTSGVSAAAVADARSALLGP